MTAPKGHVTALETEVTIEKNRSAMRTCVAYESISNI